MGLAVNDRDIAKAQAAGDEVVDRLLTGFQKIVEQALAGIEGRSGPLVTQLTSAGCELLQGLQAVEGKTVVDLRNLLDGLRLEITIPPITVTLTKPN
jgi:hypothetical protein